MESLQRIKQRISGIQNIGKITKAMELVAATKMRRSQEIALNSRPYAFTALDLLGTLSKLDGVVLPPVLEKRKVKHTAIALITSDKGLAGSFNSAVIRKFEKFLKSEKIDPSSAKASEGNSRYLFIAVGQKASRYLARRTPSLERSFTRVGDYTTLQETKPISDHLTNGYINGAWDEVIMFSSHFRSALRQEVLARKIFPIDVSVLRETMNELIPETGKFSEFRSLLSPQSSILTDYLIEPSPAELLANLVPHLVEMQLYHLILEANASEHAARRMAMKSASDNASELASRLALVYNKARQAGITRELVEITAGAEAINQ